MRLDQFLGFICGLSIKHLAKSAKTLGPINPLLGPKEIHGEAKLDLKTSQTSCGMFISDI